MLKKIKSLKFIALVTLLTGAALASACGSDETEVTVVVTATSTPGGAAPTATTTGATATATAIQADPSKLPESKSPDGTVTMADIGETLSGNSGSLPDAPMGAARLWGAGESLFTPGDSNWDELMLASSWELADDLSTVDITIRSGVKFHAVGQDWGELSAEDMAWVINRTNPAINPESIAASAANITALFGDTPVEAIDEHTIRGTFNNFDVRWASNLLNQEASGGLTTIATSKKAFDEMGKDWLRDNFVGTGPFQMTDFSSGVSATFTKVGYDHWRKNASINVFKVVSVPEEATRIALLQTGEMDVAFIDPKDFPTVKSSGFVEVSAGQGQQEGIMFPGNLWESVNALTGQEIDFASSGVYARDVQWTGNPFQPEDDDNPAGMTDMEQAKLVRQALAVSVDRDAIIEHVLGGVGTPVYVTYFSINNPNWDDAWDYNYNVDQAKSLLEQAGYGDGFQIPLFVGPELGGGSGPAGEIADAIAGFWQDIGLDVQVLKYAYAVYRPGLVSRTTTVPMLTGCDDGQESFPFDWPKGLVQTTLTRGGFSCGFESPEILDWYQKVSSEPDQAKRIELNKEYAAYMHEWALFPGYVSVPKVWFANPKYIKEWPMNLGNSYNSPENIVLN